MIITGTSGDDQGINALNGTSGIDLIKGLQGDDTLNGFEGNDYLYGGRGSDYLNGGEGNDYIIPGAGYGFDHIEAGYGVDVVNFGDTTPGEGYVSLTHSNYDHRILVKINTTTNYGFIDKNYNGSTRLLHVADIAAIGTLKNGDPGNGGLELSDTVFRDEFDITIGVGDWISLRGGAGIDVFIIRSQVGDIRLDYSDAPGGIDARLYIGAILDDGFGAKDSIRGTSYITELNASMHTDLIVGSDRDDRFILMAGDDTVNGRDGDDMVRYDRDAVDAVTVDLAAGTATGVWDGQAFTHSLTNIESVRGSRDDGDTLSGDAEDNTLDGRGGDDQLNGRGGNDILIGGDGNDVLIGGKGDDILEGDSSPLELNLRQPLGVAPGIDVLNAGAGNDILNGGAFGDTLNGGSGSDTASYATAGRRVRADLNNSSNNSGEAAADTYVSIENLLGSVFDDRLTGNDGQNQLDGGDGDDRLEGRGGADILNGDAGNDLIIGGLGADILNGGADDDILTGGGGLDTFVFSTGNDTITDFNAVKNLERIDLSDVASIVGFNDLKNHHASEVGGNLVIDDLNGNTLTLTGITLADLDAGDFIF